MNIHTFKSAKYCETWS